jgi:cation transport regulator ChaC
MLIYLTTKKKGCVYAVADGYVSRIKYPLWQRENNTSSNKYTSVYGHLKSANGAIEHH